MLKRKMSVLFTVLIAGVMLLSACATAATPAATDTPAAGKPATQVTEATSGPTTGTMKTIRVMSFFAFDNPEVEEGVVAAFETKYPDIRVQFESVPMSDIFLKYKTLIAGNVAPDVMAFNYDNAYQFGAMGSLEPLDSYIQLSNLDTSIYFKATLDMFKVDGVQYSMPATFSDVVLFYNKDLFDSAGLEYPQKDWTMKDLKVAAEKLTQDTNGDGTIDQFGYSFPWWPISLEMYNAKIWDPTTNKCTLNSSEGIKAITEVVNARYVDKYSPTVDQLAEQGEWDMFIAGKLAMYPVGPWAVQPFNDKITTFHYDIADMPAGDKRATHVYANSYGMSSASANKEAAWKFIEFATGPEGTKIRQDGKYEISPVKEIADKYFVQNLAGSDPEHASVFMEALDYAVPQPVHKHWQEINDAIWPELEMALSNQKDVTEALNAACVAADSVLAQ